MENMELTYLEWMYLLVLLNESEVSDQYWKEVEGRIADKINMQLEEIERKHDEQENNKTSTNYPQ